ncbi:hypothetical protein [Sorangium sp. So ce426]|uniref:hypothetical protein n=1 Tax=Sorangium sp. So ce426 TaxID=3133312 RepID=UPI003F5B0085
MTIRSSVALILIAGVVGVFIGRAVPHDAPNAQAAPSTSSAPSAATPAGHDCKAERAEVASTKAQLAICMAFDTRFFEAEPSGVPELSEPTDPQRRSRAEEIQRNRKLLKTYPEAVIVQHHDGRTGVYRSDEWPIDGDGVIVARKLPSGDIGWYSGPDAGPRSDPAAFHIFSASSDFMEPIIETAPDGTIMVNGEPADPVVQRMVGGRVKPKQGDAP